MPFKWTPEAEAKMLLAAVKHCDAKPSSEFFEQIASLLGPETNANGCSQKFYKLKREGDAVLAPNDSSADTGTPATPASKKKPAKKTPASSGKKRKATDDTDDAENTPATPTKKTAKTKTKGKVDDAEEENTESKKEDSPAEETAVAEDEI